MTRRAPNECPRCRSRQVERFPDSTLYDWGFALFDDGTSVADDYPDECNYRRIELLEHHLSRSRAEAERYRQQYEALRAAVEDVADLLDRLRGALEKARQLHFIDRDPYEDGRSVGLGTAVKWLRKALADHGGDDADGGVGAEVSDDAVAR